MKDGTGAWIPIELLIIDGVQPLVSFGHRNDDMRDGVREILKKGGVHYIQQLGDALLEPIKTIKTTTLNDVISPHICSHYRC